jgi:auxin influx carrier (AUX1 LAX family)
MVPREHGGEESIVAAGNGKEDEVGVMGVSGAADGDDEEQHGGGKFSVTSFLWHGGSVWDAWFSCASNQVLMKNTTAECRTQERTSKRASFDRSETW